MSSTQPCWTCKKCYGGCSWSNGTFTPVEGWKATPTKRAAQSFDGTPKFIYSYEIHYCPLYENDGSEIAPVSRRELIVGEFMEGATFSEIQQAYPNMSLHTLKSYQVQARKKLRETKMRNYEKGQCV